MNRRIVGTVMLIAGHVLVACNDTTVKLIDRGKGDAAQQTLVEARAWPEDRRQPWIRGLFANGSNGEINSVIMHLESGDVWAVPPLEDYLRRRESSQGVQALVEQLHSYEAAERLIASQGPNSEDIARSLARSGRLTPVVRRGLSHLCADLPSHAWGIIFAQPFMEQGPTDARRIDYVCPGMWAEKAGLLPGDLLLGASGGLVGKAVVDALVQNDSVGLNVGRATGSVMLTVTRPPDARASAAPPSH